MRRQADRMARPAAEWLRVLLLIALAGGAAGLAQAAEPPAGSYREALRWYAGPAARGEAEAQFWLGHLYQHGLGTAADPGRAAHWYRQAAHQGHRLAQLRLGLMLDRGEGMARDAGRAARWYRAAAAQGEAMAQNNLCILHASGDGVPADRQEALRWCREAARQGLPDGFYNLGVLLSHGPAGERRLAEAHAWLTLAAESGPERVERLAAEALGVLEPQMTAQQRDKARRLAQEFRAPGRTQPR